MSILVIAELAGDAVAATTLHAIAAASVLSEGGAGPVHVLVAGNDCQTAASRLAAVSGVDGVLCAESSCYAHGLAENVAPLAKQTIANELTDCSHVLAGSSTFSKNLLPRLAALLDVPMLAEVVDIVDAETFVRPIYAGNALATVASTAKIKVMTIRATAFPAAEENSLDGPIKSLAIECASENVTFVSCEHAESERPELNTAKVVVSGGRGLESADNFKLLEQLASKLNAAIGASRAAVDAGFVPNEYQVGQTGKVVAPDLYIAVGISGAIQHIAGMKDSKIIVAINKDPEAPIFEVADYGLVMDLFEALPKLTEAL